MSKRHDLRRKCPHLRRLSQESGLEVHRGTANVSSLDARRECLLWLARTRRCRLTRALEYECGSGATTVRVAPRPQAEKSSAHRQRWQYLVDESSFSVTVVSRR